MFPNEVLVGAQSRNEVLRTTIAVRNAHGWD